MSILLTILLVDTLLQLKFCHFSLWWLILFICRSLFALRIMGVTVKVKKLAIGEIVAFSSMLLFNLLFHKDGVPWLRIFLFLFFSLIAVGLEYLDDLLYVYVIEDVDDE